MRYVLLIDSAGDVVLADADNDVRIPIGAPLQPDERSAVRTAAWSRAGEWTAWSVDSEEPDGVRQLRLHVEETDEWGVLAEAVNAFYLCPSPCGRWLSHLSPGPLGLELGVSEVASGEMIVIERGQPLFWSWSADSSLLAVHVEGRVLITGLDGVPPRVVEANAAHFIAPWWLPGGSVAYVVDDRIVASGPDGAVNTLVGHGSSGRFSPDPDGRRLAHVAVDDSEGRLVVVDLLSGGGTVVTSEPVAAFFWSPDGNRLAVLAAAGARRLQWLVHDGFDTRPLAPFRPTGAWAMAVLPFFEQYAQSHANWSPDGTMLVAPAVGDDGIPGALLQTVDPPYQSQWLPDAELAWWA